MDRPKSPRFYGKRASEILAENKQIFLANFKELESKGVATDIRVIGSVATGNDTCKSDIDFLIKVTDDSMPVWRQLQDFLAGWICFPVHIAMEMEGFPLPECILRQAIPLEEWEQRLPLI